MSFSDHSALRTQHSALPFSRFVSYKIPVMLFSTLTIVGVGLIGGSIGMAAKKRGLVQRVLGVGRDPLKLDQARRLGAIDESSLDLAEAASTSDCIIFCTPVDRIAGQIKEAAACCKPKTI